MYLNEKNELVLNQKKIIENCYNELSKISGQDPNYQPKLPLEALNDLSEVDVYSIQKYQKRISKNKAITYDLISDRFLKEYKFP